MQEKLENNVQIDILKYYLVALITWNLKGLNVISFLLLFHHKE